MTYWEKDRKKRTVATLGLCSILLVAMVIGTVIGIQRSKSGGGKGDNKGTSNNAQITASNRAVMAICQPVDYPKTCETSLKAARPNTSDPKELIRIGFQVAINETKKAIEKATTLKNEAAHDRMAKQALDICHELMDYAIHDLKTSFDQLGAMDVTKIDDYLEDLMTWLSGSINYQQTCLNGFDNTTGPAGAKMREILKTSQRLTANSLAMVTEIGSIMTNLGLMTFTIKSGNRKLMSNDNVDNVPSWFNPGQRKLLEDKSGSIKPDIVVAKDGSGKYKTIYEAIQHIPKGEKKEKMFVIYIKEGVYNEIVVLEKNQNNVMFLGDGPTKTKITGNLNFIDGTNTYRTATVAINADNFMAKNIGFENSAGPSKHQAVAIRVSGDKAIFHNCQMDGYQDTLYAHNHRQFYRDCTITGTIDFIFGDAASYFQNCQIYVRKPLPNQQCIVTAQGRSVKREASGIVLQNCTISGDPEYISVKNVNKAYLGRPWKQFSRTVIMQSQIDDIIAPEGFLPWSGDFALTTLVYTEYKNRGPGADTSKRVKWPGLKKYNDTMIEKYMAKKFFGGNLWIPQSGVPYTGELMRGL